MVGAFNILFNLAIVAGYVCVPILWLPYLPLTKTVLAGGVIFFLTCAISHLGMAFHFQHNTAMVVVNHGLQAVSVFVFIFGFSKMLRDAHRKKADLSVIEVRKELLP